MNGLSRHRVTEQYGVAAGMPMGFRVVIDESCHTHGVAPLHLLQDLQCLNHGARLKLKVDSVVAELLEQGLESIS